MREHNRLFVAYKPPFISSNNYLFKVRKRYKADKAGFSGTLDPFAQGTLVVGFGQYTKLFQYLRLDPKRYCATLWFGAESLSFDTFNIANIETVPKLNEYDLIDATNSLLGDITYTPPIFSAKWVDGKRAYHLAKDGKSFELKEQTSTIYAIKPLLYNHPFFSFEVTISKGGYIRSVAELLAKKLNVKATLCSLTRTLEGSFVYNDEAELNPLEYLEPPKNIFLGDKNIFADGHKLAKEEFLITENGTYIVEFDDFFSIIEIKDDKVGYLLNKVLLC